MIRARVCWDCCTYFTEMDKQELVFHAKFVKMPGIYSQFNRNQANQETYADTCLHSFPIIRMKTFCEHVHVWLLSTNLCNTPSIDNSFSTMLLEHTFKNKASGGFDHKFQSGYLSIYEAFICLQFLFSILYTCLAL